MRGNDYRNPFRLRLSASAKKEARVASLPHNCKDRKVVCARFPLMSVAFSAALFFHCSFVFAADMGGMLPLTDPGYADAGLKEGTTAPNFGHTQKNKLKNKIINLQDGSSLELAKIVENKKYVWLLFWRYWNCGVCRTQLVEAEKQYQSEIRKLGGEVIAISSNTAEESKKVMMELALSYPVVADPEFHLINLFKVKNVDGYARPSAFVVGPNLKIIYAYIGRNMYDRPAAAQVASIFKSFLGGAPLR